MLGTNKLDFTLVYDYSCKFISIQDTSYYNPTVEISESTMQILVPGFDTAVSLPFTPSTINIYNSNNLGVSNGFTPDTYINLPDGLYTFQYSICPHDQYYVEKSFFRTCLLECKYSKAILKLNLGKCDSPCTSKENKDILDCIRLYIAGVKANANECNNSKASELYNKANDLLNLFLDCDDCNMSCN